MLKIILVIWVGLIGSTAYADAEHDPLVHKVENLKYQKVKEVLSQSDWNKIEKNLSQRESEPQASEACVDKSFATLYQRYAASFDAQGNLCRIYDLSFPHLKMLTRSGDQVIASVSTQQFRARDFYHWINGDYDKVFSSIQRFQNAKPGEAKHLDARWLKRLKFKASFRAQQTFSHGGRSLPTSFHGSDLEVGRFDFTPAKKQQLKRIIAAIAATGDSRQIQDNLEAWNELVDQPERLLSKIKFDWDAVKKVYNIALDGQFLPINGPIAMIDTSRPYKIFAETLLRNLVQKAVEQLIKFVPAPAGNLVHFALSEAFESVDRAYGYQANLLEATLRHDLNFPSNVLRSEDAAESINLVFLGHADLVGEYIGSMITGKSFQWDNLKDLGRKQRYLTEKSRDVYMDRTHDRLVRKAGCDSEIFASYFSNCTRGDSLQVYSLISEFSVFGYSFGAPMLYDYQRPHIVVAKRSVSYLLAGAVSLIDMPIPNWIETRLSTILKEYALVGIQDEAFLQASLAIENNEQDIALRNTLFLQNLNPLIPKSLKLEARVIQANKQLLGIQ